MKKIFYFLFSFNLLFIHTSLFSKTEKPLNSGLFMNIYCADENNFIKFLLLSNKNKGNDRFSKKLFLNLESECKLISSHIISSEEECKDKSDDFSSDDGEETGGAITAFEIDKNVIKKIMEDEIKINKESLVEHKQLEYFVLIKMVERGYKENEEKLIGEGLSPYICIIKIPDQIIPKEGLTSLDEIDEDNKIWTYIYDINDLLNSNLDLKFFKDQNALIWVYKKRADNE